MNRFLVLLGILLSIAGIQLVAAAPLPDVVNTTYQPAYNYLQNKGVVQGINGAGKPNQPLTRVEALKVLLELKPSLKHRITWYQQHITPLPLFSDVYNNQWYAPYIEVAFESSIVDGYPNGTFQPGRAVAVEEAIKLAVQTLASADINLNAVSSPRIENQSNKWFTGSINTAIEANAIGKESLRLGQPITRGQFFEIAYRLASLAENNLTVFQEPTTTIGSTATIGSSNTIGSNNQINNSNRQVVTSNILRQDTEVFSQGVNINITPPSTNNGSTVVTTSNDNTSNNGSWGVPAADHQYGSQKPFAITMPTLGVFDLTITHPTDATSSQSILDVLNHGVGHLFSYPGFDSKIMIYGHSSNFAWIRNAYTEILSRINELNPGDLLYVTRNGYVYTYQVEHEKIISPNDTSDFIDDGTGEELILYTCWPKYSVAQRYIVTAKPVL
jgi:LPXTG-site transpeptidase (sortase) family protein